MGASDKDSWINTLNNITNLIMVYFGSWYLTLYKDKSDVTNVYDFSSNSPIPDDFILMSLQVYNNKKMC